MPWESQWFDAPSDTSLTVFEELPDGIHENHLSLVIREAWGTTSEGFKSFHFCQRCGGWIEGSANQYNEHTLNPGQLAGRSGMTYHCRRCGREIGFLGRVS